MIPTGKAKEYLRQIRKLEHRVQRMLDNIDQVRRDLTALGTMDYSKDRVQNSAQSGARHEEVVAKLLDEEARVTCLIDQLSDKRREACSIIDRMDRPEEAAVLFYRYIKAMTWEQVADQVKYAERHIYRIHGIALQKFQRLMDEDVN